MLYLEMLNIIRRAEPHLNSCLVEYGRGKFGDHAKQALDTGNWCPRVSEVKDAMFESLDLIGHRDSQGRIVNHWFRCWKSGVLS